MNCDLCAKMAAEFIGTFLLMAAFTGVTLSGNALGALAVACSLMIGIYALGSVSGAHFNPAVSVAMAFMTCLKWPGIDFGCMELVAYVVSQLGGAAVSACVNTAIWTQHILPPSSTKLNTTVPIVGDHSQPWNNKVIEGAMTNNGPHRALGSEFWYTFVLVFVIFNVACCKDTGKESNWYFGLAIGMVITAAAAAVGGISMCCLNPAVSFGAIIANGIWGNISSWGTSILYWFAYSGMEIFGALFAAGLFYICRKDMKKPTGKAGLASKLLAEFLGTFVLCLTVQLVVNGSAGLIGAVGIACSLMVMIYALGAVSGANFNPAVSFALLLDGELSCVEFIAYVVVQLLGALFALFIAWCLLPVFKKALITRHGTERSSGAASGDWFSVLLSELLFTGMLVFTVLNVAVADGGNQYYGLAIGFVIIVGAASVGSISGGCFNPAVALSLDVGGFFAPSEPEDTTFGWSFLYFLAQLAAAALAWVLYKMVRCEDDDEKSYGEVSSEE